MTTGKRLTTEFGKRQPAPPAPGQKRSNHVALLMMGTLAVGGGAYALTGETCQPTPPGMAGPATAASCTSRGGSGGSSGYSRSSSFGFFGNSGSSSSATSGGVTRGGFGSFARAFGFGGG